MTLAQRMKKEQKESLNLLIEWFGGQTKTAHYLETTKQNVHSWVKRGRISATFAIVAEEATQGDITKEQLRPDVLTWGKP